MIALPISPYGMTPAGREIEIALSLNAATVPSSLVSRDVTMASSGEPLCEAMNAPRFLAAMARSSSALLLLTALATCPPIPAAKVSGRGE